MFKTLQGPIELKADAEGSFRAVFSTFSVIDRDQDVTLPGAFAEGQEVRISSWGHNWGDLPVGRGVIHSDQQKAWVDGQFFLDTTRGLDTYKTVKALGSLQEWSYGFEITKSSFGTFQNQRVRFLEGMNVFEVSPVMVGAGIDTRTDAIKAERFLSLGEGSGEIEKLLTAFVAEAKALHERRATEDRVLSPANRESIAETLAQLRGAQKVLDELLAAADPAKAGEAVKQRYTALALRARTLALGRV